MDRRTLVFLLLFHSHITAAVSHSLKYFLTGSSHVQNFPEFVVVGMVDDVPIIYYDSNIRKTEPKQDWMNQVTADDPKYWERQTETAKAQHLVFSDDIANLKQRFNQTGGIHINQMMYGCEWDDQTQEINGYHQEGYDGEDFIMFDVKTETWITAKPQALMTKMKRDHRKVLSAKNKHYLTKVCSDWLKKYVTYGRRSLLRTAPPSVSLLQTSPSSPVSCYATGFYPDRAEMFWRKDGEQIHEDVDQGEILPNHDGTFQMRVDLDLSSVRAEDWRRYDCVFQLSGAKDDVITKLDKAGTRTNEEKPTDPTIPIIAAVVVVALVLIAVVGIFLHKKLKAKRPPSPVSGSDVLEELNPET